MSNYRTRATHYTNKTIKVLEHLQKFGSITSLEAIDLYGATRLSAIIFQFAKAF